MVIKDSFEIMSKYDINDIVAVYDNNNNLIIGMISNVHNSPLEYTNEEEYKFCIKYDIEYLDNEAGRYKQISSLPENKIIYVLRKSDIRNLKSRVEEYQNDKQYRKYF